MKQHRTIRQPIFGLAAIFLILLLALGACSGGGADDDDASEPGTSRMSENSGGGAGEEAPPADSDDAGGAEESEAAMFATDGSSQNYAVNQAPFDRLIIRTVTLELTVEDVAQGSNWIRELATRNGGFVFSSNTYVRDEREFAQITIRIPSDQLDGTVGELREHSLVIQVDSEESTSQDVSQEYVDNESRLEALEETQRRFIALLSEADTVEEILRIESELTNIRTQIETIKGRQNYLEQMTSFSTVTVTLHADGEDIEDDEDEDGFLARTFGDGWDDAQGVIEGILGATITIGIIGLALAPLAAVLYVIGRLVYRRVQTERAVPPVADHPAPEQAN